MSRLLHRHRIGGGGRNVHALVVGLGYGEFRVRDLPRIVLDTVETTGDDGAGDERGTAAYALSLSRLPQNFGGWLTQTVTLRRSCI